MKRHLIGPYLSDRGENPGDSSPSQNLLGYIKLRLFRLPLQKVCLPTTPEERITCNWTALDMSSSLLLALCVWFLALFGAFGAPTRAAGDVNYTQCKVLSVKLNAMARDLYHKVRTLRINILLIYLIIFSFSIVSDTFSGCRLK